MEILSLTSRFELSNASTAVTHAPLSSNNCENFPSHEYNEDLPDAV